MSEGFRIEKGPEKNIAKFQGLEMVPGGPITKDIGAAIKEIRDAHILDTGLEGKDGFDEFQALVIPKDGKWPELEGAPDIIKSTFVRALAAEQERNPRVDSMACHISVRVQGDAKVEESEQYKAKILEEGRNLEDGLLHFDGNKEFGGISEYLIAFSGPTTIQYLGEVELPPGVDDGDELTAALSQISASSLRPVSPLPGHLYHMTHRTPHAEPMTLPDYVSDEKPRLFMRLMFAKLDKSMVTGQVYEA